VNREITKKELVLAIAMSGYYQTTHVHYIPPQTNYTSMLRKLRNQKMVEPLGEHFWKLTLKGRIYLRKQGVTQFQDVDNEIDKFIDKL
jgi:hypothetical protein